MNPEQEDTTQLKELSLKEIQEAELTILDLIADHCERNNITYFLAYGSLLGAVRHEGFIPWDDDADVWFPRRDFERFLETFNPPDYYRIIKPFDGKHHFVWGKIVDTRIRYSNKNLEMPEDYGLTLDLFPLDEDYGLKYNLKARRYALLYEAAHISFHKGTKLSRNRKIKMAVKRVINFLPGQLDGSKSWDKLIHQNASPSTYYVRLGVSKEKYEKRRWKKDDFGEGKIVSFQNNHAFRIPINPEPILDACYGDWRTPKEYNRHAQVYWKPNF